MVKLITENHELLGLLLLLGLSVIASIFLHWIAICGQLYRHGARFPTGLLPWRAFRELRRYRDITCGLGKSLTLFYFGFILAWFNLLLAFAIAVRMLWLQTHPGGY